jgi:hypothetical protein
MMWKGPEKTYASLGVSDGMKMAGEMGDIAKEKKEKGATDF